MILGVDISRLAGKRTGVGRVYEYLIKSWAEQEIPFERVELFSPAPIGDLPRDQRLRLHVLPSRGPGIWWETVHLGRRAPSLDLLLAPYALPVGYRGRCVVENHGVLFGEYGPSIVRLHARARGWHVAHSARRADRVIAISDVVRDDLVRWCRVPREKISVIRPAISARFRPAGPGEQAAAAATAERVLGRSAPFFVFVGKLSRRRHVPELLRAFARMRRWHSDLHLLIVGPNTAGLPISELAADADCGDRVVHVEHLDHETLTSLYQHALAFVLPTTKEAWSLTISEALACGTPVVTVDGPWLDDDGIRDAVMALPAPEVPLLEEAMRAVAADEALRAALRAKALHAASRFPSHEQRARRVMSLLAETARA